MVKNHLTRLTAPKSWTLKRKLTKWIAKPSSGPHKIVNSVTVDLLLKTLLSYTKTTKEVKQILHNKDFVVNGKVIRDHKFPVGVMDIIELPKLKEIYQVLFDVKGKLSLYPIKSSSSKLCKVIGLTILKKKKMQVNLHDGKNILLDKFDGKVGDTVIFNFKSKQIEKVLKLEKDALIYLIYGKHTGTFGSVKEIIPVKGFEKQRLVYIIDGVDTETLKDYVFVVDKGLIAI